MYYLNYGAGSEGDGLFTRAAYPTAIDETTSPNLFKKAIAQNEKFYKTAGNSQSFTLGIYDITVYSHGLHRSILIESGDRDAINRLENAIHKKIKPEDNDGIENWRTYSLLSFNCVTAVSTVLNLIAPWLISDDYIIPQSLDKKVNAIIKANIDEECDFTDTRDAVCLSDSDTLSMSSSDDDLIDDIRQSFKAKKDVLKNITSAKNSDSDMSNTATSSVKCPP